MAKVEKVLTWVSSKKTVNNQVSYPDQYSPDDYEQICEELETNPLPGGWGYTVAKACNIKKENSNGQV